MNVNALKAKLKASALEQGISFNQIWKALLLERFLARLSHSRHNDKFVFKGGLLLANYIDIGRETMDIDLSLKKLTATIETIRPVIIEICNTPIDDGIYFNWDGATLLKQPHMQYSGHRILLNAHFGNMKDKVQIDIGIGDVVKMRSGLFPLIQYRGHALFSDQIKLNMYPAEAIFAEKLETIISKGEVNSRMKDYHDLLLMTREPRLLDKIELKGAIQDTFLHRKTKLKLPIQFNTSDTTMIESLWKSHIKGLASKKKTLKIPDSMSEVVDEINRFLEFMQI